MSLKVSAPQYSDAESEYRRTLIIRRNAVGDRHPDVAQTYNNLGLTLVELGHFDEAEECYDVAESILADAGDDHRSTLATCMNNQAGLLHERGRNDEAEKKMKQVIEIRRAMHGELHPAFAFSLKNLATFLHFRGLHDQALEMLSTAMNIESGSIGIHHPTYGNSLNTLGGILLTKGEFAAAEAAFKQAGDVFFNANGDGEPADADAKFNEAFEIMQRLGFPHWFDTHNLIANYLSFLGQREDWPRCRMIYSCLDATQIDWM